MWSVLERLKNRSSVVNRYRRLAGGVSHEAMPPIKQAYAEAAIRYALQKGRPLRLLEIGSWCGFSAALFAESIARYGTKAQRVGSHILCVDPWIPYFSADELAIGEWHRTMATAAATGEAYEIFCHNASIAEQEFGVKIDHARGLSTEILPRLAEASRDFIYIDGSHRYADVAFDISESRRIVVDGGLITGDDLDLQVPDVSIEEVCAKLDLEFHADPNPERSFHPGVTLAVHEAFGSVSKHEGFWLMQRFGDSFVPVALKGAHYFAPSFLRPKERRFFLKRVSGRMLRVEPSLRTFLKRVNVRTLRI